MEQDEINKIIKKLKKERLGEPEDSAHSDQFTNLAGQKEDKSLDFPTLRKMVDAPVEGVPPQVAQVNRSPAGLAPASSPDDELAAHGAENLSMDDWRNLQAVNPERVSQLKQLLLKRMQK